MALVFGPHHAAEFRALLRPADILVFDRLGLPGGLIQWGDECPANHASLITDKTHSIEANRVEEEPDAPAVKEIEVCTYFEDLAIRTITLLRHKSLADDTTGMAEKVIARARKNDGDPRYAYQDVIPVGLLAVNRRYGKRLRDQLGNRFDWLLDKLARELKKCVRRKDATLMCSEFVYRCFTESGTDLKIDIADPLLTNRALTQPLNNRFAQPPERPPLPEQVEELWSMIIEANYGAGRRQLKIANLDNLDDPLADAVSPGDLWCSSSLIPIAAFHRPPERPWVRPGNEVFATALDQLVVDPS